MVKVSILNVFLLCWLNYFCGSTAPEVLAQRPYSKTVDCWSIGVITYILWAHFCSLSKHNTWKQPIQHLDNNLKVRSLRFYSKFIDFVKKSYSSHKFDTTVMAYLHLWNIFDEDNSLGLAELACCVWVAGSAATLHSLKTTRRVCFQRSWGLSTLFIHLSGTISPSQVWKQQQIWKYQSSQTALTSDIPVLSLLVIVLICIQLDTIRNDRGLVLVYNVYYFNNKTK